MSIDHDPWLELRRLQASPPRSVMKKLQPEFRAALEQAESYHRAARGAGPESSPVMLYYSLVQLGRAIVIAGHKQPSGSHGLKVPDVAKPTALFDRCVKDTREGESLDRSHFASLQNVLGEEQPSKLDATFGELIDGNPDLRMLFRERVDWRPIVIEPYDPQAHLPYDKRLPPLGFDARVMTAAPWQDEQSHGKRLARYPVAPGATVSSFAILTLDSVNDGWYEHGFAALWHHNVNDRANVDEFSLRRWAPAGLYTRAHQDRYVISPLAPTGAAWSRLTWWWPLLYALGHIARYEPLTWTQAIDVAADSNAADLREALRIATEIIPSMGAWAVNQAMRAA